MSSNENLRQIPVVEEKKQAVITMQNDHYSDEENEAMLDESGSNLIDGDLSLMDSIADISQSIDNSHIVEDDDLSRPLSNS